MSVSRPLTAASWLFVLCSTAVMAQDAAPKAAAPAAKAKALEGPFLVRPYLQLGHAPAAGTIQLLWHADDVEADWSVAVRPDAGRPWRKAEAPTARKVSVAGVAPHRVYRATLTGLEPGGSFEYVVSKDGRPVFSAEGRASKSADQPYRFVAFGDCGSGTPEQLPIAYQAFLAKPDFVMVPGDIVYSRGRASEYREKFWPIYNAQEASPATGVPMLRSTPFIAAPGNHDIATRDLDKYPDTLAYFYYWDQPLNGPVGKEGDPLVAPLVGSEANKKAFYEAAREAFPRMANFSFDYGNAHWTILDANPSVDWNSPELREWVERDLTAAKGATWRFVCFHQPGFNSSKSHFEEQHTRVMSPVFEAGKVDLVFTGHVHNYQRSYPLHFAPAPDDIEKPAKGKSVGGKWTLDKSFDGRNDTTPDGVIYLVTGAGGQHLYNPEQQDAPDTWQEFTHKFISKVHSFTVADVDGKTLTVRQVTADGTEVDRFTVTK